MIVFPNAKINIGLNIVEKREDGFHNIETIFYPIKIHDALEVIESKDTQFFSEGKPIPGEAKDNICLRAYHLLKHDFNLPPVHIHLLKNIPIGAGLGGGSSNGAYFIKLLNDKFNLKLNTEEMEAYARKLGSDCAFFIENNPVFAVGKGDQFIDLELDLSRYFLVLVKPSIHVSTADAYGGCKSKKPLYSLQMLVRNPVSEWKNLIVNDFEETVFKKYPEIRTLKEALYASGALYVSMSGSGSSVYAIFAKQVNLPAIEAKYQVFYDV